jgi:3-deoxy-D-manno-octulosonic acid hydroxylase-like protein
LGVVRITNVESWSARFDAQEQQNLLDLLEDGQILWLPALAFGLLEQEQLLRTPSVSDGRSKNISFDPQSGRIAGCALAGAQLDVMRSMMARFSAQTTELVREMLPAYAAQLRPRLASYRPLEVEGRGTSDRKDDTRLHVDAFASRPNQGQRILRVFCNVNDSGKPRTWLVGEPFEPYARRFLPYVRKQWPLEGVLLERLRITKQRRTRYDHCMLQLHDRGKLDETYQRDARRERIDFPPGSTWICFTDQVLHAALGGQYLLEQTFLLPPDAMRHPERSPLRTLERLTGRALV